MRDPTPTWSGVRPALLLLLCLLPLGVLGNPPMPGDDSIRARLKACLLTGEMACVVDQYLALQDIGRVPGWIDAYTGLAGLPLTEYMKRLGTSGMSQVLHEVVKAP
ncbi:hypothetical protein CYFUS_005655 [Cystobacter fuscus]|uniref:Uncharacterized protein n=1 Tax=Cystobacter fuscus TaxID=43 RepID=A0A250J9N2_9BACT|nr:hypothetical protein [Cystobacter fuscus]ATB40207.1 hypothetical protein CYFUS_005655 [Cystobacter fuscus]